MPRNAASVVVRQTMAVKNPADKLLTAFIRPAASTGTDNSHWRLRHSFVPDPIYVRQFVFARKLFAEVYASFRRQPPEDTFIRSPTKRIFVRSDIRE